MHEQLVTFETAKLAKEKGFDIEQPKGYYNYGGKQLLLWNDAEESRNDNKDLIAQAPTQTLLQKWLREKHAVHVEVNADYDHGTKEIWNDTFIATIKKEGYITEDFSGDTYEECLEYGLQEGLKLI